MHWIYILQGCNGQIYVGETTRLFRRFWEHEAGEGGINTKIMGVEKVLAIYKVVEIGQFLDYHMMVIDPGAEYKRIVFSDFYKAHESSYDAKVLENALAEHLMISRGDNWESVRGGEYVRFVIKYDKPESSLLGMLPFCKCGLPCDVKVNQKSQIFYFRCPLENFWGGFKEVFDLEDVKPCDFNEIYKLDEDKKKIADKALKVRVQKLKSIPSKYPWVGQLPTFKIKGQCLNCNSKKKSMITYPYLEVERALCIDCFCEHSEVLEAKLLTPSAPKQKPYKKGPQMFKPKKK